MSKYDIDETETTETENQFSPAPTRTVIRGGWKAVEDTKNSDSPFAQRLKVTDDPIIVKFLDDEPYASWKQHWVERQGQKSFVCIGDIDDKGCPLCDAGSRPSVRIAFNIALLDPNEEPTLKSYEVGPRVISQLQNFHNDPRTGPLSKHYWAISKTGKGATTAYAHQPVKERDLEEWGIDPISESILKTLRGKAYTADIIQVPTRKDLLAIADEDLS